MTDQPIDRFPYHGSPRGEPVRLPDVDSDGNRMHMLWLTDAEIDVLAMRMALSLDPETTVKGAEGAAKVIWQNHERADRVTCSLATHFAELAARCPGPDCVVYTCPTNGEDECTIHGGFDVCCNHPECPGNPKRTTA